MEDQARHRQREAIEAATAVARGLGLESTKPAVLKDSNNTIVHLAPAPIVAKVATTTIRQDACAVLEHELSIGLHLAARDAPIAAPVSSVPPGPHHSGTKVLTLWDFCDHDPDRRAEPEMLAAALKRLHDALADYGGELQAFSAQVEEAGRVLHDPSRTPKLGGDDRDFLHAVHQTLLESLQGGSRSVQPLHGDPHIDGNVLRNPNGPVFVDFEAACVGPTEWDLSSLPTDVASFYPGTDGKLLEHLRLVRGLCVAVWCWMQPDRAPEVAEAARHHLSRLRAAAGRIYGFDQ